MEEEIAEQPLDHAHRAVDVASDRQAGDIVMLDIRELSDFTDYFVILTAESSRQMQVLSEAIEDALEKSGLDLHHREGTRDTGWMLLDFGDLIVHIFGPEEREFYNIEDAWSGATEVIRIL